MTNNNHPITPPDDLQEQWKQEWLRVRPAMTPCIQWMLAKSAQWGADQELEACCEWLETNGHWGLLVDLRLAHLRAARRPKPPSLAKTAMYELDEAVMRGDCITTTDAMPHLRAALELLAELENLND